MASEGTSTSSDKDRMDATQSAVNIIAQGKRNMVCGEIPTAVNQFQEACQLLSKAYGETAKECAEAYFCYGQALLDLARMENGVLGNALQGVPETDDESTEQKDEQFEKAELEDKERDKIRKDVYDAMSEKENEKADREKKEKEKKEGGETMEVAMDTEDSDKKPEDKDAKVAKDKDAKVSTDEKEIKDKDAKDDKEKKPKEDDKEEKPKEDDKVENPKDDKEKPEEVKKGEAKADEKETKADKKKDESEKDSTEDGDEEEEEEGTEEEGTEEEEGEGTEEEGAEGEDKAKEEGEGKAKEEGDTTSQTSSQDGENPDDVSNLQLAWEMLELAKLIYKKDDSKEAKLRVAEAHLKLGEVSLETEQYEEATKDFNICLTIQKEFLEADNRLLAETYYQLGLGYSFNKQFNESVESYQAAIKVIEARIDNLNKDVLDKATQEEKDSKDYDTPVYKANKEVTDLKEILPDIKTKIEDVEEERKNMEDLKNLAKEALGGIPATADKPTASGEAPKAAPASDISHLIKRKRKSEDAEDDKSKKLKQENGEGDAPKAVNGDHAKEEKPEQMETKS